MIFFISPALYCDSISMLAFRKDKGGDFHKHKCAFLKYETLHWIVNRVYVQVHYSILFLSAQNYF